MLDEVESKTVHKDEVDRRKRSKTLSDEKAVENLKVVSATFVLVCFLSLNETTFQIWKNAFYFTSKALFVLKKIKFKNSALSKIMTSSNT